MLESPRVDRARTATAAKVLAHGSAQPREVGNAIDAAFATAEDGDDTGRPSTEIRRGSAWLVRSKIPSTNEGVGRQPSGFEAEVVRYFSPVFEIM